MSAAHRPAEARRSRGWWVAAAALALAGCGGGASGGGGAGAAQPGVEVVEYSFRARIVALPAPGAPLSELQLHHEEMPSFRREDGSLGMASMTMAFPLASPSVLPADAAVGDAVDATIRVDYDTSSGAIKNMRLTRLTLLPFETVLTFERNGGAGER